MIKQFTVQPAMPKSPDNPSRIAELFANAIAALVSGRLTDVWRQRQAAVELSCRAFTLMQLSANLK